MKLWVVLRGYGERGDYDLCEIFATSDLAAAWIEKQPDPSVLFMTTRILIETMDL